MKMLFSHPPKNNYLHHMTRLITLKYPLGGGSFSGHVPPTWVGGGFVDDVKLQVKARLPPS
jgi:hypothetical protein